jgi:hypothetical protein
MGMKNPRNSSISKNLCVLQANITLLAGGSNLSGTDLDMTGIKIEEHGIEDEENCMLVIASNILLNRKLLETAANALTNGACILAREKPDTKVMLNSSLRLELVFEKTLKDEKLLLLRKVMAPLRIFVLIGQTFCSKDAVQIWGSDLYMYLCVLVHITLRKHDICLSQHT